MVDQLTQEVGERVRFHRLAVKKTQSVVAGLAGITTDYLYQIERGKKLPTLQVLLALARALELPPTALITESTGQDGPVQWCTVGEDLHRVMTLPLAPSEEPLPLRDLRRQVNDAWRLWQSSRARYSQVGRVLGQLITEVERTLRVTATADDRREAYRAAADLYGLARTVTKRMNRMDLSGLAADRGYRAAEACGDSLRIAAARWNLAHVALAGQHHDVTEDIALTAANELYDYSNCDAAAMYGSLVLVAGIAAARRSDTWVARDRIRSIAPIARRTGECNTLWTAFGPTNVAMYAVSIEVEAGEVVEASRIAEGIEFERSLSIERRVAFLLEQARCCNQLRDYSSALVLLQKVEREAPEDLVYRPSARIALRHIVQHAARTTASEAATFAERIPVPMG